MPVSVVVGGQYGSEGKGKVSHWMANRQDAKYVVRVGGPNSGHTAISDNRTFALRQLPTPSLLGGIVAVIPAGGYLNVEVLLREIRELRLSPEEVLIHPDAVIIDNWMREEEVKSNLTGRISSTGQGVGSAVAHRVFRDSSVKFAKDEKALSKYVQPDVNRILAAALHAGDRVIVEGTQGFGLSNIHGGHYPFATSRDTSAAGALSEAGLSPVDVDCIALVIRSYPIRVAGNSGPLLNETSWESVTTSSGAKVALSETTTVTGKVRRIGRFDPEIVRKAISVNNPTHICLNHVDYFDFNLHETPNLSRTATHLIGEIEASIGRSIDWIGTGPSLTIKRTNSDHMSATAA